MVVGFVLAIKVLPIIVFVASLMAILYHLGIMQRVVALLARALSRVMGISGAEALSTIGDVFLGMTEAPLLVRPYVARMTDSELFAVMTAGMATIAGSVLLAYTAMGIDAGYLVTASFMSAPAAVMIAKIMVPEKGTPETLGQVPAGGPPAGRQHHRRRRPRRGRGAAAGAQRGRHAGRLRGAGAHGRRRGGRLLAACSGMPDVRLGTMLGWPLAPLAWLMGVPWSEAPVVGALLGTKMVLNEFLAYRDLAAQAAQLSPEDGPHRQLRAVRLRQLRLAGGRAGRAGRHGARAPPGPGPPRPAGDPRRLAGHLPDRHRWPA